MKKKMLILIPASLILFLCAAMKAEALPLHALRNNNVSACHKCSKDSSMNSGVLFSFRFPEEKEFIYYSQQDPEWKDYLYGGRDPMYKYGCGPTVLAMLVSNLTPEQVTPAEMADWAASHGYFSPGGGSSHSLIPEGATAFGLKAESLSIRSPEALQMPLYYDKLVVLLMGPGHFTQKGHFIILTGIDKNGNIKVADPFNSVNNTLSWSPQLLLDELSVRAVSGGPVWVISAPQGRT